MKGELHIWEDGKAILTITEGALDHEGAMRIVDGMREANNDPKLLAFNFPVEVIEHDGPVEFVGVGEEAAA